MAESPFKSPAFQKGLFISLAVNGAGLLFACSVLGFGFFGLGLSSFSTLEQMRETWLGFVGLAFCCPTVLQVGLLAFLAFSGSREKDNNIWKGWLAATALSALPFVCMLVFSLLVAYGS